MSEIKVNSVVNSTGDNDSGLDLSTNDKIGIKIANAEVATVDTTGVVFNDASADRDFRVESNGQANMLFVDGGNDTVSFQPNSGTLTIKAGSGDATNNVRLEAGGTTSTYLEYRGYLGHQFYVDTSEKVRIHSTGATSFGTTDASPFVATEGHVVALNDGTRYGILTGCDHIGNREAVAFVNPNGQVGSIRTNGTATSFNTSSDHRIKENVEDMTGAIDRVKQLLPKRFNFIADADTTVDGFLAHEAQSVVAEAVHGTHNEVDDDGNPVMQGIDQSKLVPLLTGALKEAIAKIEALETRVTALEG